MKRTVVGDLTKEQLEKWAKNIDKKKLQKERVERIKIWRQKIQSLKENN